MAIEATGLPSGDRERAHYGMQHNDHALAEASYARVLEQQPEDLEALQYLANAQLARGFAQRAIELLERARKAHPGDPATCHQLGAAQMMDGNLEGAAASLGAGLAMAPRMFVARLRLGIVLEQLGRNDDALLAYFSAIFAAQEQGRWLNDGTTAAGVREAVKHAIQFVDAGRRALFDGVLAPLRERYGASGLRRVEHALAIYLGELPPNLPDPRQKPKFLYFPDIPSQTYYPRERFPWYELLESNTGVIREELRSVLAEDGILEPFLGPATRADGHSELVGSFGTTKPAWDAFFFYRHGDRFDEHCDRAPRTAAILGQVPMAYVRDHSPETLFSVLRPGSHILMHRGVTNTRLVTHLPLIVPEDCAISVGGELHAWKEGRCVSFDDTFAHEAWNKSDKTRVVLILDCWNPDLTEIEREAINDLVGAIGDFNTACNIDALRAAQ